MAQKKEEIKTPEKRAKQNGDKQSIRCRVQNTVYNRDVKLIFTGGHISLTVAFKGPNVILGLYKCNYSLQGAGRMKQSGGPDSAHGPCVCLL